MTMSSRPLTVAELSEKMTSPDELRRQLDVDAAIRDLNEVGMVLRAEWATLSRNQIEANRLRVELAKVKLAKALPDLKAIEHSAGDGESDKVQFVINLDGGSHKL